MKFTDSKHCASRRHCTACRSSRTFRLSLAEVFELPEGSADFACPHGQGEAAAEATSAPLVPPPVRCGCRTTTSPPGKPANSLGWGTDWLISSACYTSARPFGVLHNVSVVNPWARGPEGREIDRYQPAGDRQKAWRELMAQARLPICSPRQIRTWLPKPRMRCINLDRATERRERFTKDWIDDLGFPVRFFSAFDRREVEAGKLHFSYDEATAKRRTGRPLSAGEIACVTSHALVMREEIEFCGPEGVFIFEDDCVPLPGANEILRRVQMAATALSGIEVIAGHEPNSRYTFSEQAGGAVRIVKPPWGFADDLVQPTGAAHR